MNRRTTALAEACRRDLLAEKWLLAPSRRVAHQRLDAVVRTGQPVVNVRTQTFKSLAADLALAARQVAVAPRSLSVLSMHNMLGNLQCEGLEYADAWRTMTSERVAKSGHFFTVMNHYQPLNQ